ncbi:SOS response-associated peptidase [Nocardioides sp.]|uniref:SOS response-associated peptidase n=1 Tax=Nocardioides sp. TaxID=35761 RepID=UPI0026150E15|nr:SOS response-associated peptidase [Nocardioides sp.]
MCGRYASSKSAADLALEFEASEIGVAAGLPPSYNVAPTDEVYIVAQRPAREERPAQRQLRTARWGLVPSWAKERSIGARMINARLETVADKPAFRKAFATRRCLVPADGYFEWYRSESGTKQPFFIHPRDGRSLAMAGLYEFWRDPAAAPDTPLMWSCTIITTSATDDLGRLHDRMPLVVEPEDWEDWLGPEPAHPEALVPAADQHSGLEAWPVSTAVGNVRNNTPELIVPLPATGEGA